MNSLLKFAQHLAIPAAFALAIPFSVQAQNPVESTHVDEKFAYTTVVYKSTAASDKEVLSTLENDFSIGDVVRVTLAPPPAPTVPVYAAEPVYADKRDGEDTWVPEDKKPVTVLTAATTPSVPKNTTLAGQKPVAKPATPVVPKPVVAPAAPKASPTPAAPAKVEMPQGAIPIESVSNLGSSTAKAKSSSSSTKASKSAKSSKKSGKKGGSKMKLKNRKHGKQRYGCPKF